MKKITVPCAIKDGLLELDRRALGMQLKILKDGDYTLTIEPVTDNISHRQRKYFFGVVIEDLQRGFSDAGTALNQQQVRDLLEELFLFRETYNPVLDKYIRTRISLSNSAKGISKEEFQTIKEKIQEHASTVWGIYVHDPNEKIFND